MSRGKSTARTGFSGVRGTVGGTSLGDASRKAAKPKPKDADRDVTVPCWCERKMMRVPLSTVNVGKTASCGARKCYDPNPTQEG